MLRKKTVMKYFGCENDARNNITPVPGSSQKMDIPNSTANRWIKNGWIADRGRFVLTTKGYYDTI